MAANAPIRVMMTRRMSRTPPVQDLQSHDAGGIAEANP